MAYQSAYRSAYRPYRCRRRRRNSHYGVLIALILVIIIAVPVAFRIVKGISGAIFGGDQNELVYQVDNTRAYHDGKSVDLGTSAAYRGSGGAVFVPVNSLCDNLGLQLSWDQTGQTASIQYKKDTASVQVGSTTLRFNEENKTMSAAPEVKDGITGSGIELVVVNDATPSSRAFLPAETEGWGDNTFEAHRIPADGNRIYLHGMDMRGTIYAIYSFSEKFLGVPPLWYWCSWQPEHKDAVEVPAAYSYFQPSPTVRYRAWFPNDEDLFIPWRAKSSDNNELWLETMLRLKLNTVEHTATVTTDGTLNSEAQLYKKYGLVLTSHHMIALNNSFANWDAYWKEVRHTTPPPLSVKDMASLKEFWQ